MRPAPYPTDPGLPVDVVRHLARIRAWHREPSWTWQPWPPPPDAAEAPAFWVAKRIFDAEQRELRWFYRFVMAAVVIGALTVALMFALARPELAR